MLATHETGDANAARFTEPKRKQHEWYLLLIIGHKDKWVQTLAHSQPALPMTKEVKALIGSIKILLIFQASPNCFGLIKVSEEIDPRDWARLRPSWRICRAAFDRGSHGHRNTCLKRNIDVLRTTDFCKEVSTKGNDSKVVASGKINQACSLAKLQAAPKHVLRDRNCLLPPAFLPI